MVIKDIAKINLYMIVFCMLICISCTNRSKSDDSDQREKQEIVIKKRKDGTRSSINQIDEFGNIHGYKISFYADGKSVYSELKVNHGIKHGPAVFYYKDGTISYRTTYKEGKKQGAAKRYYKNGKLMAAYSYDEGNVLPGLKEYNREGELIEDYPEIKFREENHLKDKGRIDLIFYSSKDHQEIKYYIKDDSYGQTSYVYLISEKGSARTKFPVPPGKTLEKKVMIKAEIKTNLGNILVRELSYDLKLKNII